MIAYSCICLNLQSCVLVVHCPPTWSEHLGPPIYTLGRCGVVAPIAHLPPPLDGCLITAPHASKQTVRCGWHRDLLNALKAGYNMPPHTRNSHTQTRTRFSSVYLHLKVRDGLPVV